MVCNFVQTLWSPVKSSNLKVEIFESGKDLKQTIVLSEFLEFRFRVLELQDSWIIYKKTCKVNLLISCLRISMVWAGLVDFTVSCMADEVIFAMIAHFCFHEKWFWETLKVLENSAKALCTNLVVTECCFSGTEAIVSLAMDRLVVLFGTEILKIVPGRVSTEVDARFVMLCCHIVL